MFYPKREEADFQDRVQIQKEAIFDLKCENLFLFRDMEVYMIDL